MVCNFELNKSTAHLAVIGGSGKGKSVYTRAIVQQQVNKNYIAEEDVLVFTTKSNQLSGDWAGFTCYDSLESVFDEIWQQYTEVKKRPCLIILDDFLNDKNFNANVKNIERLFTEGRKNRIHGLMTSHTANSINNKCRGCVSYVVLFPTFDNTEIDRYAESYVNGDSKKLIELFNQAKKEGMYTCVVRDPQGQFTIDKCNPENDLVKQTADVTQQATQNVNQNAQINGIGNNITQMNFSPMMLQQKEIAQKNEFERLEREKEADHQRAMNMTARKHRTRDLIKTVHRTNAERIELINNLNILSKNGGVNEENLPEACHAFIKKFYPDEEYIYTDTKDLTNIVNNVSDNKFVNAIIDYTIRGEDRRIINNVGNMGSALLTSGLQAVNNWFEPQHRPTRFAVASPQVSFGYDTTSPAIENKTPQPEDRVMTDEHYELYRILNGTLDYHARQRAVELLNKLRKNPNAPMVNLKNFKERAQAFKIAVFDDHEPVLII